MSFRIGKEERSGNIQKIGDLFPVILKTFGLERAFTIESIRADWSNIAGNLASASEPEQIKDRVLFIKATHPAISQEIVMMKSAIISRFNEKYQAELKDIRLIQGR